MAKTLKCTFCGFDFEGRAGALTCSPRCRQLKKRGRGLMVDTKIHIPPERTSKTDCVIRAIVAATGIGYRDVLAMIGPEGRKRKGYSLAQYGPVLDKLGFVKVEHTGLLDLASLDQTRSYFATVRQHAIGIVRGVAIDTWHSTGLKRRRKLKGLWLAPKK